MVDQHSGIYQETNGTGALMSHRCLPPTLSKMNAITVQNKCRHRTALFDHKQTRGIRTRDGRRVGKLPRAYGGDTGTVRDPAVLLPALARKPRAWGESPIRADFPDRLRSGIDAMESRERQRTLRLIHRASESAGFDAAARAAEHLVEQGHGIDEASLMTLARRIAAGETPHDEPAPDLHDYDRFMRPSDDRKEA